MNRSPGTAIHNQVAAARVGSDPHVIARLFSGWAVLGTSQFLLGYALLLPDPVVPTLETLDTRGRGEFLLDMTHIGDALLTVSGASRIDYAIFGNLERALHAHIAPRYEVEPSEMQVKPAWVYDWSAAPRMEHAAYRDLIAALRDELTRMGVTKPMRFRRDAKSRS